MHVRVLLFVVALTSCGGRASKKASDTKPVPETPPSPPRVMTAEDSNYRLRHGVPAGYRGVADDGKDIKDVTYRLSEGRWIITTGPAHIMYSPVDTLSGSFTTASTFDQTEAPAKPEAFGLFIGGADLESPTRRYTYFMVRGTGEFVVGVREGEATRELIAWTTSPILGKQNDAGFARYRLAIRVRPDSVRFFVGGKPIAALKTGAIPTDGVAGLRINRNLKIKADVMRAG